MQITKHVHAIKIRKKYLLPIISLMLGLIAGLLIGEVSLRLIIRVGLLKNTAFINFINSSATDFNFIYRKSKDPLLGCELIPKSRWRHIRVNSGGFRGKEYDKIPPPRTTRIVLLGDSEAFGIHLEEDETISGYLEQSLNEKVEGRKSEVLNFGVPGYNTIMELRVLKAKTIHYNPSIVILYYVFNDPVREIRPIFIKRFLLLKRSYLYLLYKYLQVINKPSYHQLEHQSRDPVEFYKKLHSSEDFEHCKKTIKIMGDFLKKRGIRFIVVIAPEIIAYDDFDNYPYKDIHSKLLELSSPSIEVIDPLDAIISLGVKPTELWVIPSDCHKGKKANQVIAEEISKHILFGHER